MRKTLGRVVSLLFVIVSCILTSFEVGATAWHPFTRTALSASDLLTAISEPSSQVTLSQFRDRVNLERAQHGLLALQNDAALVDYLVNHTVQVSCESLFPSVLFVLERTDGRGNFSTKARACKPSEQILVERDTSRPVASLDCGNVIFSTPTPTPPPVVKKKQCGSTVTPVAARNMNGFIGIPIGANSTGSSASVAVTPNGAAAAASSAGSGAGGGIVYPQIGVAGNSGTYQSTTCY